LVNEAGMFEKRFGRVIPVYMINGFLESGKTEFIQYTLSQDYFQTKGTTLLIVCEEGEVEYDENILKKSRTVMEIIEDEEDFTPDALEALAIRHQAVRVVVEFNGMWNPKEIRLPSGWQIDQQITTIDAGTFGVYFNNMRSIVAEQIRGSELVIVNRCDGIDDLASYKRNIKSINAKTEVVFEDKDGELNVSLAEELPYDLNAEVIKLDDAGYAIWYMDIMDNLERYDGRTIEYIAMVVKPPMLETGYFVPGRMAMTCCADDIAMLGFICKYDGAKDLPEKSFIRINATVHVENRPEYQGMGPVLYANSIATVKKPKNEVIDFSAL